MKTPQSVEASLAGARKKALMHVCCMEEIITDDVSDYRETPAETLKQLRDHAEQAMKFLHEFNAYHNVLFTE